jgi:hypothetical protein
VLREHANSIEHEISRALRGRSEADEIEELERAARRETEPTPPEFEPLSADVAPQMTLFGGAAPAPARALATTPWAVLSPDPPAADAVPEPEPREIPAFERRARLRDERHRLVSEVRRRDGTSHQEINAWLNRKLGITSVDQATLDDLERSVELLVGKLSRRR